MQLTGLDWLIVIGVAAGGGIVLAGMWVTLSDPVEGVSRRQRLVFLASCVVLAVIVYLTIKVLGTPQQPQSRRASDSSRFASSIAAVGAVGASSR